MNTASSEKYCAARGVSKFAEGRNIVLTDSVTDTFFKNSEIINFVFLMIILCSKNCELGARVFGRKIPYRKLPLRYLLPLTLHRVDRSLYVTIFKIISICKIDK